MSQKSNINSILEGLRQINEASSLPKEYIKNIPDEYKKRLKSDGVDLANSKFTQVKTFRKYGKDDKVSWGSVFLGFTEDGLKYYMVAYEDDRGHMVFSAYKDRVYMMNAPLTLLKDVLADKDVKAVYVVDAKKGVNAKQSEELREIASQRKEVTSSDEASAEFKKIASKFTKSSPLASAAVSAFWYGKEGSAGNIAIDDNEFSVTYTIIPDGNGKFEAKCLYFNAYKEGFKKYVEAFNDKDKFNKLMDKFKAASDLVKTINDDKDLKLLIYRTYYKKSS